MLNIGHFFNEEHRSIVKLNSKHFYYFLKQWHDIIILTFLSHVSKYTLYYCQWILTNIKYTLFGHATAYIEILKLTIIVCTNVNLAFEISFVLKSWLWLKIVKDMLPLPLRIEHPSSCQMSSDFEHPHNKANHFLSVKHCWTNSIVVISKNVQNKFNINTTLDRSVTYNSL